MKTVNFLNKTLAVSASLLASVVCESCLGQEATTANAASMPKMSRLAAFHQATPQGSSQDAAQAAKTGVLASLSDGELPAYSRSSVPTSQPSSISSYSNIGGTGFQKLANYRTGMPVPEHLTQSHLRVPGQYSDLGRYRTGANIGSADLEIPGPPAWESRSSLVTAAPAAHSSRKIQDISGNFHEDLRSPLNPNTMKGSGLQALVDNSTPTQSLEESNMVLLGNSKTWVTPDLYWQPLYFEDAAAERYGHHAGVFQPTLSAGRFLRDTIFLPYKFSAHPPHECEFGLGYQRPGNCVEPRFQRPEISGRGLLGQGAAMTGLIFLF